MRFAVALSCLMLLAVTGCERFGGEWVEEGAFKPDGTFQPADPGHRQAMRFDWPATIRYGSYADSAGVVDNETVQWDQFWTMKWDHVVQSGAMSAHLDENGKLIMVVDGEPSKQFVKVKGDSIFPPQVKFPSLSAQ